MVMQMCMSEKRAGTAPKTHGMNQEWRPCVRLTAEAAVHKMEVCEKERERDKEKRHGERNKEMKKREIG